MKVTIVGAGAVGASCAEYIAIKNFVAEVVLLDIKAVSYTHLTLPTKA